MVAITINARLTGKDGKVLWSNPNFLYPRAVPGIDRHASFFEEDGPAVQRMAESFSKDDGCRHAGGVLDAQLRGLGPLRRRRESRASLRAGYDLRGR